MFYFNQNVISKSNAATMSNPARLTTRITKLTSIPDRSIVIYNEEREVGGMSVGSERRGKARV